MSQKILIIEDDPTASKLAGFALMHEGFDVFPASNGVEGLQKAEQVKPDLIILDFMMPHMDGYEVCKRLRALPETADVPILMLSAKAKAQDMNKWLGHLLGINAFLAKPANPSDIVSQVKNLLSRKQSPAPEMNLPG